MAQHLFISSDSNYDIDIKREDLSDLVLIDSGGFGTVYKGTLNKGKENEQEVAVKYIIRKNTPQAKKDFTREHSKNIPICNGKALLGDFGLSKYLNLTLDEKISFNKAILKGLEFLHNNDILHRDLHSKNILICNGKALLGDFGLSKYLFEQNDKHISEVRGVQAYVDPKLLDKESNPNYTHTKESDIYSYGVLMWEIYACRPPFQGRSGDNLTTAICLGEREKPENGMPSDYIEIYEKCWHQDPSFRPGISKILKDLETLNQSSTYQDGDDVLTELSIDDEHLSQTITELSDIDEKITDESVQNYIEDDCNDCQITNPTTVTLERSVNFDTFSQPIKEAHELFKEIRLSNKNAQLNTRICGVLVECINLAKFNLKNLQDNKSYHAAFATLDNYKLFQIFLQNIRKINSFIKKIFNIRGLRNYIQKTDSGLSLRSIKVEFERLFDEFNKSMLSIKFKTYPNDQVNNLLNDDIEETIKLLGYSIQKVDSLGTSRLKYNTDRIDLCMHVALLKNLEDFANVNIIKFYGILQDESSPGSIYLIIEKADYGNLKEYYTNYKPLDFLTKSKFALEICTGLVFLNAVNFLHHDIRSENILITNGLNAKIANFNYSRSNSDNSGNLGTDKARIKSMAPEMLERKHSTLCKYDFKSEIYSFGIVLWEILNEKNPYDVYNNIYAIRNAILYNKQILHNYSNFNNCIPQKYTYIMMQALKFEPNNRPTICDMFRVLFDIVNNPENSSTLCVESFKENFSQHNFLSIEDAANEARKKGGNKQKALEYIDKFAEMNDFKAIYYKGYFMQQKLFGKKKLSKPEYKRIQKEVAHLFELASDANITDAHTKYGDCLFNGYGVQKNQARAIELYTKAAIDGNGNVKSYAQFRLGSIYYKGLAGTEDKEEGAHYLKLAAWGNYEKKLTQLCDVIGVEEYPGRDKNEG
ncbi:2569_t:CDS:2, partial [Racocetra persica]